MKSYKTIYGIQIKKEAQAAHIVHFRLSLYGWKDNFKELPMAVV
jgi:hypothetical protein